MKSPDQYNIFLVDDDPFSLFMYQRHLHQLGYANVSTFSSGGECIAHLGESPDIIFLDHQMANMSGMDVMKTIKRVLKGVHVVFLSGQEDVQTVIGSLQNGAYEYIFKGDYDLEKITEVMNRIIVSRGDAPKKTKSGFLGKLRMIVA